eukprot:g169.t1
MYAEYTGQQLVRHAPLGSAGGDVALAIDASTDTPSSEGQSVNALKDLLNRGEITKEQFQSAILAIATTRPGDDEDVDDDDVDLLASTQDDAALASPGLGSGRRSLSSESMAKGETKDSGTRGAMVSQGRRFDMARPWLLKSFVLPDERRRVESVLHATSTDDGYQALRYLRAHNSSVGRATAALIQSLAWRKEVMEPLLHSPADIVDELSSERIWLLPTPSRDGNPVIVFNSARATDVPTQAQMERMVLSSLYVLEKAISCCEDPLAQVEFVLNRGTTLDNSRTPENRAKLSKRELKLYREKMKARLSLLTTMLRLHYPGRVKCCHVVGLDMSKPIVMLTFAFLTIIKFQFPVAVVSTAQIRAAVGEANLPQQLGGDMAFRFALSDVMLPTMRVPFYSRNVLKLKFDDTQLERNFLGLVQNTDACREAWARASQDYELVLFGLVLFMIPACMHLNMRDHAVAGWFAWILWTSPAFFDQANSIDHNQLQAVQEELSGLRVQTKDTPLIGLDAQLKVTVWNTAMQNISGWRSNKVVGHSFIDDLVAPGHKERVAATLKSAAEAGAVKHLSMEIALVVKVDGISNAAHMVQPLSQRVPEVVLLCNIATRTSALREMSGFTIMAQDITERVRLELARKRFVASISHELRTPLAGIMGMLELLSSEGMSERARQFIHKAKISSDLLLNLVNDILDMSRIEAGKMDLDNKPYSVEQVAKHAVELVAYQASSKGLKIDVDIADNVPADISGDVTRYRQVLLNLLSNAVKFTVKGGVSVHISADFAEEEGVQLRTIVKDTGVGISKHGIPALFQMFSKVDSDSDIVNNSSGCGLGLAISNRLVALMGGKFDVQSEQGKGSTFTFTILARYVPVSPASSSRKTRTSASTSEVSGSSADRKRNLRHRIMSTCKAKRVLLAEDNAFNAEIVTAYLESSNLLAKWVSNGQEAQDEFKRAKVNGQPYDVVIMDCQMPVVDGWKATRNIREWEAEHRAEQTPIIALTAYAMESDRKKCDDAGMDTVMTKPVKRNLLTNVIAKLLDPSLQFDETESVASTSTASESSNSKRRERSVEESVSRINADILTASLNASLPGAQPIDEAIGLSQFGSTKENDTIKLRMEAHSLKGAAAFVGASALSDTCDRLMSVYCIRAGMDQFVVKPIGRAALIHLIAAVVNPDDANGVASPSAMLRPGGLMSSQVLFSPVDEKEALDLFATRALYEQNLFRFVDTELDRVIAIKAARQSRQWGDVHKAAHSLKGSASAICATSLVAISTRLLHATAVDEADEGGAGSLISGASESDIDTMLTLLDEECERLRAYVLQQKKLQGNSTPRSLRSASVKSASEHGDIVADAADPVCADPVCPPPTKPMRDFSAREMVAWAQHELQMPEQVCEALHSANVDGEDACDFGAEDWDLLCTEYGLKTLVVNKLRRKCKRALQVAHDLCPGGCPHANLQLQEPNAFVHLMQLLCAASDRQVVAASDQRFSGSVGGPTAGAPGIGFAFALRTVARSIGPAATRKRKRDGGDDDSRASGAVGDDDDDCEDTDDSEGPVDEAEHDPWSAAAAAADPRASAHFDVAREALKRAAGELSLLRETLRLSRGGVRSRGGAAADVRRSRSSAMDTGAHRFLRLQRIGTSSVRGGGGARGSSVADAKDGGTGAAGAASGRAIAANIGAKIEELRGSEWVAGASAARDGNAPAAQDAAAAAAVAEASARSNAGQRLRAKAAAARRELLSQRAFYSGLERLQGGGGGGSGGGGESEREAGRAGCALVVAPSRGGVLAVAAAAAAAANAVNAGVEDDGGAGNSEGGGGGGRRGGGDGSAGGVPAAPRTFAPLAAGEPLAVDCSYASAGSSWCPCPAWGAGGVSGSEAVAQSAAPRAAGLGAFAGTDAAATTICPPAANIAAVACGAAGGGTPLVQLAVADIGTSIQRTAPGGAGASIGASTGAGAVEYLDVLPPPTVGRLSRCLSLWLRLRLRVPSAGDAQARGGDAEWVVAEGGLDLTDSTTAAAAQLVGSAQGAGAGVGELELELEREGRAALLLGRLRASTLAAEMYDAIAREAEADASAAEATVELRGERGGSGDGDGSGGGERGVLGALSVQLREAALDNEGSGGAAGAGGDGGWDTVRVRADGAGAGGQPAIASPTLFRARALWSLCALLLRQSLRRRHLHTGWGRRTAAAPHVALCCDFDRARAPESDEGVTQALATTNTAAGFASAPLLGPVVRELCGALRAMHHSARA